MKIVISETVYPNRLSGRNCHASHCLPMRDGSVLAVWFEGEQEGKDDVCIWSARRSAQGVWSEPRCLTEDDGVPHWNPVLFEREDGAVLLYFKRGKPIARWQTMLMISRDGGETFSEARELVPGDVGGRGPVRNKIIRLSDGMLLAPASDEDGEWTSFIDRSPDGENWEACERLRIFDGDSSAFDKRGIIQPTLWESAPGKVHALLRSSESFVYRTDSSDGGRTWCAPYQTALPNNNSGIDLDLLPDGTLALACNPVGGNWGSRNPLSLLLSADNGESWTKALDIVCEEGKHEFSYPCVICRGRELHVTYTVDRVNIAYVRLLTE